MELWTTDNGEHRVMSLKCGHLFCKQCLEEGLRSNIQACPLCNQQTNRDEMHTLYLNLEPLDTSGWDMAITEAETLQKQVDLLEVNLQKFQTKCSSLHQEKDDLKLQLDETKNEKTKEKEKYVAAIAKAKLWEEKFQALSRVPAGEGNENLQLKLQLIELEKTKMETELKCNSAKLEAEKWEEKVNLLNRYVKSMETKCDSLLAKNNELKQRLEEVEERHTEVQRKCDEASAKAELWEGRLEAVSEDLRAMTTKCESLQSENDGFTQIIHKMHSITSKAISETSGDRHQ